MSSSRSQPCGAPKSAATNAEPSAAFTPGPWFAGPEQPEDEYGAPGGVSVGPFDLAVKYGARKDYTPAAFCDHYEDQIAYVSGCNHDPVANARLIAAAPSMHSALERIAAATPGSTNSATIEQFISWVRAVALTALADAERSEVTATGRTGVVPGGTMNPSNQDPETVGDESPGSTS